MQSLNHSKGIEKKKLKNKKQKFGQEHNYENIFYGS